MGFLPWEIRGWGCSSVGRASDRHVADASSIPRCGEGLCKMYILFFLFFIFMVRAGPKLETRLFGNKITNANDEKDTGDIRLGSNESRKRGAIFVACHQTSRQQCFNQSAATKNVNNI